jgi:hypothetical protein
MRKKMSNIPTELTKEDLWHLLGWYAAQVGDAEGILFTSNKFVLEAVDEFDSLEDKRLPEYMDVVMKGRK